ncbi:MAG TPA: CRTAC1 family protein [Acidobacteriota bacterium]|nr:CRTAC1 family protein [Acidobacteriota bacterium]
MKSRCAADVSSASVCFASRVWRPRRSHHKSQTLILLFFLFLCACNAKQQPQQQQTGNSFFTEITQQSNLKFFHDAGVDGTYFMPESLGSGAAFFDYNNDGKLDIFLINAGPHNKTKTDFTDRLFKQQVDGKFVDVTQSAGLTDSGYGLGVAAGDIDNDGNLDLYVTNYGNDVLFRNNGNGTFTNITNQARITNSGWSASVIFLDYDRDGYLDIYIAKYLDYNPAVRCTDKAGRPEYCGPQGFQGLADVLYHNNRDATFTDVSSASGISTSLLKSLGVVSADFNNDNYPDIYVANDGEPNNLWINQKDGTFQDLGVQLGTALNALGQPEASMGVTAGDIDADLDLDFFMTHLRDEKNTLYRNLGKVGFQDDSWSTGLAGPSIPLTGFGTGMFDFDNDGDLDIAVVNGRIARGSLLVKQKSGYWDDYAEPNLLFENDGTGKFTNISGKARTFCSTVENSRGLALGDVDNDGDVDLLVTNDGGPARLYRNEINARNHWLLIRAIDPALKRDAIGAKIIIQVQGKRAIRLVSPQYSYLCSNDPRVHFGLGSQDRYDRIEVEWPDGRRETFDGGKADQILTLMKGHGN